MKGYTFYNNLLGWISGLIAFIVYQLTLETSVSLWDCGEFIAASYKLMVVHPPGAPFFLMLGRIFSMFAGEPEMVAYWVNTMSGLASAMAVMFTFWIITHFAKKLSVKKGTEIGLPASIAIFSAGLVGALSMTFMDSFWFSAVEAEVYALSSFFTMVTFWAALKWESSNSPYADRWLILIALLIGLSIGTHLLSLLVIPAVAFIYYFKKTDKPTWKGGIIAFVVGFLILTFVQNIMIPGIPKLMSVFDLLFVNTLGFGFHTGSIVAILFIISIVIGGILYSLKNNKRHLHFAFISLAYILLGYSSYTMVVVRSSANPPIDMNNPADPFNLLSYINREQYGDRPLLYGPYFNAELIDIKQGKKIWSKGEKNYTQVGTKQDYKYEPDMQTFLPRMGDMQKDGSAQGYRMWSGMGDVQNLLDQYENQLRSGQVQNPEQIQSQMRALEKQKPSFANNLQFLLNYQLGHMYFRYFMWNFAGRQNDQQGHYYNKEFDGNWISGISFVDEMRLGPQDNLHEESARNMARNKFYFLPLLLGILGIVFQFKKAQNDFIVNLVFFLYTGILIIIFLNMPPYEPRERDYAVVGSFQVFCIWIGLGVLFVWNWLSKYLKGASPAILAGGLSLLAVPVLMGSQGWDDHDRSQRRLGIDFAINYLESCAPNAILFTNGDNDTYPLWYAQNVEGIRTDIRIINMSLLPTDWYSSILLDKVYESEPLPLTFTKEELRAGNNDFVKFANTSIDQSKFYPLDQIMEFIRNKEKMIVDNSTGEKVNYLPVRNFRVAIDKEAIIKNNVVPLEDTGAIINEMRMTFNRNYMHKGDMVFFDLIANNAKTGWQRPIYFTTTTGRGAYYGLEKYFQLEGLAYRLVPIETPPQQGTPTRIAEDILYDNIMNKFKWSGMKEKKNFFLDEKAVLVPQNLQTVFVQFASELTQKAKNMEVELQMLQNPMPGMPNPPEGREAYLTQRIPLNKERAMLLLDKAFEEIPESVLYMRNQVKYYAALTYYDLEATDKAYLHATELYERNLSKAKYYAQFEGRRQFTPYAIGELADAVRFINMSKSMFEKWGQEDMKNKIDGEAAALNALVAKLGIQ